jgi:hypothetical protein
VSGEDLIYLVLPFVVGLFLAFGFVLVLRQRATLRRELERSRIAEAEAQTAPAQAAKTSTAERPWWGTPWLWLAICGVFVVLGFFVWPGLFGFTFLFLPFVWVSRPRRREEMDPRTNGHSKRDGVPRA